MTDPYGWEASTDASDETSYDDADGVDAGQDAWLGAEQAGAVDQGAFDASGADLEAQLAELSTSIDALSQAVDALDAALTQTPDVTDQADAPMVDPLVYVDAPDSGVDPVAVQPEDTSWVATDSGVIQVGATDNCNCMDVGLPPVDTTPVWDTAPVEPQTSDVGVITIGGYDPLGGITPVEPQTSDVGVITIGGYDPLGGITPVEPQTSDVGVITIGGYDPLGGITPVDPQTSDVGVITIGGYDPLGGITPVEPQTSDVGVITIGGYDPLGGITPVEPQTSDVGVITIGGYDPLGGITPVDPQTSDVGVITIGGYDLPESGSFADAYLQLVQVGADMHQRAQDELNQMMLNPVSNVGYYDPTSVTTLFNLQKSLDDQVRLQILPSYTSEYDSGLVYSPGEWMDKYDMSIY